MGDFPAVISDHSMVDFPAVISDLIKAVSWATNLFVAV